MKVYLDNRANKDNTFPIRLSLVFCGKRIMTSLGYSLNKENYNNLLKLLDGKKLKSYPSLFDLIVKRISDIENAVKWQEMKIKMGEISVEQVDILKIINDIKGKKTKEKHDLVSHVFLDFIRSETKRHDLKESTVRDLLYGKKYLLDFDNKLTVAKLCKPQTLSQLVDYYVKKKFNSSTIKSIIRKTKWFLNWCYKNNLCDDSFKKFDLQLKTISVQENLVVFLTFDEIQRFEKVETKTEREFFIKQMFLFQCYTGLRYSDVLKLKKTDIKNGIMSITTKKTNVHLENRLNKYALAVFDRVKDTYPKSPLLFHFITTHSINEILKEMACSAGIDELVTKVEYRERKRLEFIVPKWQLITTHVGRKSFVVNSLDLGLTPTQVIAYTGHSTIQAMQPYISISQKKKDAAMEVWNGIPDK